MQPFEKSLLLSALVFLFPCPLFAEFEFAGFFSLGRPQGKLKDYSFGAISTGGTARLSWRNGEKSSSAPRYYTEISYLDLGVENGFIPAGPDYSEQDLDVATDFYLLMFSPGISFGKVSGDVRPYFDLSGGPTYYSTLSRIASRHFTSQPVSILQGTSGATWHVGLGAGIKILLWERAQAPEKSKLDNFFFNAGMNYGKGGKTKYLNWRSVRSFNGVVSYNHLQVNSDMLQFNLGGSLEF